MKKFLMLLIFAIAFTGLSAQKAYKTEPISNPFMSCFEEPAVYPNGDPWVSQGTISIYTMLTPYAGHTYEFSVPLGHGVLLASTPYTATVLWVTPGGGYSWGYLDVTETSDIGGCVRILTKNVVITP